MTSELANVVQIAVKAKRKQGSKNPDWLVNAVTDERGRLLPNLANVMLALRAAPELIEAFSFHEMLRSIVLDKHLPKLATAAGIGGAIPRRIGDIEFTLLQEWLQCAGLPKIGRETVYQAVDAHSRERGFHPVRDYLEGLVWDGNERLETWLARYLGAESSAYQANIGGMFLVGMVARIYRPGVKVDHMVVLEGPQGGMKSTACKVLGGDYFSDSLPDIRDKDAKQHMRGKWLIEIAELSAIRRADAEALKHFISRTEVQYRPAYGRDDVSEPRQCVFIGTTNKGTYLRDETGNRRFWPVKVGAIDIPGLTGDRDQLFAEAVARYRAGAAWWPDSSFEREVIKPVQDARFENDAWQEFISVWLLGQESVLIGQVAREALHIEAPRIGKADQNRISEILISLGWRRAEKKDWRGNFPWTRA